VGTLLGPPRLPGRLERSISPLFPAVKVWNSPSLDPQKQQPDRPPAENPAFSSEMMSLWRNKDKGGVSFPPPAPQYRLFIFFFSYLRGMSGCLSGPWNTATFSFQFAKSVVVLFSGDDGKRKRTTVALFFPLQVEDLPRGH